MRTTFILCALLMLAGCKDGVKKAEKGDKYPTITLKRENRELRQSYPATLRGRQDVEIRPQVSGKVTKVCMKEGGREAWADALRDRPSTLSRGTRKGTGDTRHG